MPAKTVSRRTRFRATPRKTSSVPQRPERFEARRTTVQQTKQTEAAPQKPKRAKDTKKRGGWASEQHATIAGKFNGGQADGTEHAHAPISEQLRRELIRERNRRRRYPWLPALGATVLGLIAYGMGALYASTTSVPASTVATVFAVIAVLIALGTVIHHRAALRQWGPEFTVAGLGTAAVVYWIGVSGLSWATALVLLLGTIAGGTRWWHAHPIGPGVAPVHVPEPQPQAEPEPVVAEAAPTPETDPYCVLWAANNAKGDGKAKGSRLTNRRVEGDTITYDVELKEGNQSLDDLLTNRRLLASGLRLKANRLLFKPNLDEEAGEHQATLTVLTKNPVEEIRFYTGPQVEEGVIKNVARFADGLGEASITMWDDMGTVPTMIVGSTGGGKSGAANVVTTGALSTGLLNLLYADPKGNSSTALATRARVAIIGKENVLKLPVLIEALKQARGDLAASLGSDLLFPSKAVPGWMLLHDEFSLVAKHTKVVQVWTETVNVIRALGLWGVALNQSLAVPEWGNDHGRSAWASQVVAFRINSESASDLVPGLVYNPKHLPVTAAEGGRVRPVPGYAVHAYLATPVRWDFLPSDADAERMKEKGKPAPPHTTTSAFDAFFNQPELHPADVAALESVLGPAVNGRWQVGGFGSTHSFPEETELFAAPAASAKPRAKWGQRSGSDQQQLSQVQTEVLALVRGGTTETGEIVEAAKGAKSSVMEALDVLASHGLIRRVKRGVYEPITQS